MSAHIHVARDQERLAALAPGFPCLCLCNCSRRHWHISTDLCSQCLERAWEFPMRHGEP